MARESDEKLLMIIDPASREAHRRGEGPRESGPVFFTTREKLEQYARDTGIRDYAVHEVPAGVLARMKGKPFWLDGEPR